MADDDLCPVCCAARLTPSRATQCAGCGYRCCKRCLQTFLLGLMDEPQCMNCRQRIDHTQLVRLVSRSFVDTRLKRHREDVLLDRQRALIPATQPQVERERTRRKRAKRLDALREERVRLLGLLHENAASQRAELALLRLGPVEESADRRAFVMRCVRHPCRGFLNEHSYRCTACELATCPRCLAPKDESGHACTEEDVATASMLRQDSKRCPGCGAWVHRYEGCSLMWCVQCHVFFDYNTLRVHDRRDRLHNPHYIEWLAQQRREGGATVGREAGDVPCGGAPTAMQLSRALHASPDVLRMRLLRWHRVVAHAEDVVLPAHRALHDDPELEALRIQFCLGDFDEAKWKSQLQRIERRHARVQEVRMVLEMVVHACGDLFRQIVVLQSVADAHPSSWRGLFRSVPPTSSSSPHVPSRAADEIADEVEAVVQHANTALCRVADTFSCRVPHLVASGVQYVSVDAARAHLRSTAKGGEEPVGGGESDRRHTS